ncbi:hypothetical protein DNTS_008468 [Danionella cerebrum]|uniref:C-type lectin domain-containing protein n=1 Tax=Danionella cerebrum TaxID=2873325 RepID=A0A553QQD5_9TELE|nr:hypothetical protein DNTS_008468 [Danionella translucida]
MGFWTPFYLLCLLDMAFGIPESSHTVHLNKLSFRNAQNFCKPGSYLTSILDKKEMQQIVKAIWAKNNTTVTSFWVGLKKDKGACVKQGLSLKGFYWTADNGTQADFNLWKTEPSDTCTDVRCGLLSVEYVESGVKTSGLIDATCKQEHAFICRRNIKMVCPHPQILDTHDLIQHPQDPHTCQVACKSGARFTLTCSKDLLWTVVGNENADVSQLCLECKNGYRRDASGNCVDVNECEESSPCKHRCQNTDGSYECVCENNDEEDCNEPKPPTTHLRSDEYSRNDEDESVLAQPTSLPDDVRRNETEVQVEESKGDISNIIVPVIIALLIFIVLVVIVAAIVKGCLRRRTIKRARKKAEAVALNGSSSVEKVNEKE